MYIAVFLDVSNLMNFYHLIHLITCYFLYILVHVHININFRIFFFFYCFNL